MYNRPIGGLGFRSTHLSYPFFCGHPLLMSSSKHHSYTENSIWGGQKITSTQISDFSTLQLSRSSTFPSEPTHLRGRHLWTAPL